MQNFACSNGIPSPAVAFPKRLEGRRSMSTVDLAFALVGTRPIPSDHSYLLYASLSRLPGHSLRERHCRPPDPRPTNRGSTDVSGAVEPAHPAGGRFAYRRTDPNRRRGLNVGGQTVRVGVPSVPAAAVPRAAKPISDHQRIPPSRNTFQEAVRRQLDALALKKR